MLKTKMTDELFQLAKSIKKLEDPLSTLAEFKEGKSPEDINLDDDIIKVIRQAGFLSLEHFFYLVLYNSIEELEEYRDKGR